MRFLTFKGDKVVKHKVYTHKHGRFLFFFCNNGVFYVDTTVGTMWKFSEERPESLGEEHLKMVREVLAG